jgi:multidrug efflux system membrane fusion protein
MRITKRRIPVSEKRLKIILPIALLAFGVIVTFIMLKSRAPVPIRSKPSYAPVVRDMEVVLETHQLIVTAQGTVTPRTQATLISEISGRVTAVAPSFAAGGFFNKGEVLISIDSRDYELAVVTARGQVAQARVRAETEQAQSRVAREEWEELGDGQDSPLATRELQLQEARAALASAEAALEGAERNLERTRIRAPYDCRVREKLIDVGQFVSTGTPAAQIYAIDYVEVRLPVPDVNLAYLDLAPDRRNSGGNPNSPKVLLQADFAGKLHTWEGRIVRTEGEIDPVSRMVTVVAQVDDPYGGGADTDRTPLSVGLFVVAEIIGRTLENVALLPRSAVRNNSTVLVIDDKETVHVRKVEILRMNRDEAIITGGLAAGERVCITSLEIATEGMKIRTMRQIEPTAPSDTSSARADS